MAFKIEVYCLLVYSLVCLVSGDSITVDGHWSPWSKLETACSRLNVTTGEWTLVTCGGGVKKRFRSCTNPSPQVALILTVPINKKHLHFLTISKYLCRD